jgi:hypothetical protein
MGREQGMIKSIEECVERFAGKATAKKIMEGSERMTAKTGKAEIAQWVKDAVGKMDTLLDEKTRSEIMMNCGFNCAEVNKRVIEKAKARRRKFKSVDEFLEAEKVHGTIHIAFGHNLDYPNGKNPSKNHIDFLMSKPTVKITNKNGETKTILQAGKFK